MGSNAKGSTHQETVTMDEYDHGCEQAFAARGERQLPNHAVFCYADCGGLQCGWGYLMAGPDRARLPMAFDNVLLRSA